MEKVRALLVSHEHWDHVKGLPALLQRRALSVYATEGTSRALARQSRDRLARSCMKTFGAIRSFGVGPWTIRAFPTPHDAEEPVGFILEAEGFRVGIATDMGSVTPEVVSALSGLDALVLEFNHDPEMLAAGPYRQHVKARIASPLGHLSNEEAGGLLHQVAHEGLRLVILAHLSQENNEPHLALRAAEKNLNGYAVRCRVAPRGGSDGVWDL